MSWISKNTRYMLTVSMLSSILMLGPERAEARPPALLLKVPEGKTYKKVSLSATRLTYRPGAGKIELSGKVTVTHGMLAIHCGAMKVLLNNKKQPQRLEASKRVKIKVEDSWGEADKLQLDIAQQVLVLSGNARLFWGKLGMKVKGRWMEIDMKSGKLVVHDVKADLKKRGN